MAKLWTIKQAAAHLGVPEASLAREAEAKGFLIRIGRVTRLDPEDLDRLVDLCRVPAKAQGSFAAGAAGPNLPTAEGERPAQRAAKMLKQLARERSGR